MQKALSCSDINKLNKNKRMLSLSLELKKEKKKKMKLNVRDLINEKINKTTKFKIYETISEHFGNNQLDNIKNDPKIQNKFIDYIRNNLKVGELNFSPDLFMCYNYNY